MKILQRLILIFTTISLANISFAQTKKNSLYIEALGNAIGYSINYDRVITLSPQLKVVPRVGFEFFPRKPENYSSYGEWSIPSELNILYGKNAESKNYLEGGLGLSLFSLVENFKQDSNGNAISPDLKMGKVTIARIGFRHQNPTGGLMYRAGIMFRLAQDEFSKSRVSDDLFYRLWPGFSVGYSF